MRTSTVPLAIILVGACTTLSACDMNRRGAEAAVRENLKDPESARFGEFYYNSEKKRACFEVNAKNSMGGYTGDKQVQLDKQADGWVWVGENDSDMDTCRSVWADRKDE